MSHKNKKFLKEKKFFVFYGIVDLSESIMVLICGEKEINIDFVTLR